MIGQKNHRIESIDLLRGAVMVIMALDHVRDFFHYGSFTANPTDLATTTPAIFFTRWITHFCAPVFIFLSGTSAYLFGIRMENKQAVSRFLWTRGLWLMFLELTVVNFVWTFDTHGGVHVLQVIFIIGFCMVCLSGLIYLPQRILIAFGIAMVALHNLFDPITATGNSIPAIIWYFLHQQHLVRLNGQHTIVILYPAIPWVGIMALGYALGSLYQTGFEQIRKRWLLRAGLIITGLFFVVRFINLYGDLVPWQVQKNFTYTVLSFFNATKYPPSLCFLLMTLGPALIFLHWAEGIKNTVADIFITIGRVPLFFYVIHIFLVHLLALAAIALQGMDWHKMILTPSNFFSNNLAHYGYPLYVVYLVWIAVVIVLYPFCKVYARYKAENKNKWWLSYL